MDWGLGIGDWGLGIGDWGLEIGKKFYLVSPAPCPLPPCLFLGSSLYVRLNAGIWFISISSEYRIL
ncbi:hypothetical protein CLI64_16120 [Nostoc sp. CENA543]|nr:hypothetical protein CLI64_16120 [Nostoc sp. CENA543]